MLRFLLCLAVLACAIPHADLAAAEPATSLTWTDIRELEVEGQGWTDTQAPYDRLPAKADGKVRAAVWSLSRHSAGLCVRFVADAPEIHARWVLASSNLAMPHMAATGVSGLDLYVKPERGPWRWLAVGRPESQTNTSRLVAGLPSGKREYLLYLPLYLKGADLLGDDGEGTVDSSHPTDLGFMRQADALARVLGPLLKQATRQ